jgi:glycosyltransferase involved in cell wall biosynthesis
MISVCIPTLASREPFLAHACRQLAAYDWHIHTNWGEQTALESFRDAIKLATQQYCMCLSDDDALIDDALQDAIEFMERHNNVIAYIAPWQYEDGKKAYECTPQFLTKLDAVAFFNDICNTHMLPEIGIYRTEAIKGLKLFQEGPYWAYTNLIELLKHGDVYISNTPFYTYYLEHPTGLKRETVGQKQLLTDLDTYRAGLEVYIYEAFRFHNLEIPFEMVVHIQKWIRDYMLVRLKNALAVAHNLNDPRAPELWARIKANGG